MTCISSLAAAQTPEQPPPPPPTQPATPPPAPPAAPPPSYRDLARASLEKGDVAGACALFERAYEQAKGGEGGARPDDVLFDLADCHERLGKLQVARAEFEQIATAAGPRAEAAKKRVAALKETPMQPAQPGQPNLPNPVEPVNPDSVPPPREEGPTRIGDFMDTRLSWTFGDDDVLHATGQAFPLSPNASIGDRPQYRLFFDNLNSRFAGRENLTHLALYKKMPGFIRGLDTEASLVIRFDLASLSSNTNNLNQAIYDAGSFIRAFYHTDGHPNGKVGLGVTFWPIDTDRFRLGYLYDISWGGTNPFINQSIFPRIQGSAPGAKVQFDGDGWSIFAGFKTASIIQVEETLAPGTSDIEQVRIAETNLGFLAGGNVDITPNIRFDANGGYFQQGKFDLPDVEGNPVYTFGGSGRLFVHDRDMPAPISVDFALYRNDPNKPQIIFAPVTYMPGKTTWSASFEYTNLFQHLKDFDNTGNPSLGSCDNGNGCKIQQARAAAIQANLQSSYLRASLTGIYRDLPFVLRNQPSFIPFETIPTEAKTTNEIFVAGAADYYIDGPRLTPGIGGGIQFPATFQSNETNSSSAPINRTVVVRQQGNIAILPVNQNAVPIVQVRGSLKWDLSQILSAVVWVQYVRDNNGTFVERDPNQGTTSLRTFISPDFLGFGTSVQARF